MHAGAVGWASSPRVPVRGGISAPAIDDSSFDHGWRSRAVMHVRFAVFFFQRLHLVPVYVRTAGATGGCRQARTSKQSMHHLHPSVVWVDVGRVLFNLM